VAQPTMALSVDRVVGIERHCQANELGETSPLSPQHAIAVEVCHAVWGDVAAARAATTPTLKIWLYLEIIVRTEAGTIYRVELPPTTQVSLNDEWPPK
jgi:hypothetical protein